MKVDDESQDLGGGAFYKAMEMIKKRNPVQDLKSQTCRSFVARS